MYLPTTAILTCFFGLTTRSTNLRQFVRSGSRRLQTEQFANEVVESFVMQHQRHLVNGVRDIARFDHRLGRETLQNIESFWRNSASSACSVRHIRTCGCKPISRNFAMLCCVGLVFNSRAALI